MREAGKSSSSLRGWADRRHKNYHALCRTLISTYVNSSTSLEGEITGLQQTVLLTPSQVDTEGAVTIGEGSLFQYFTTLVEKDDFLPRRLLGPCRTLAG